MSSGRVPSGINDFDDEEYQMAIAMSLSVMAESNNNDNNNNNNNNNDNNDNNNNNENNSGDNNNNNNDNNDDNNIINEEEEENDDFIQQYTINCIYRRALCGAYDPILVLDEIMEGDDEKDKEGSSKSKTAQRGLLDTSLIADESEKRILEMNDAKLISSLPIFTRLLMQNLNKISTEGKKNLAKCANFALLTLKCYKNAVESSIYLLTREICPLFDTQKLYAFLSDSISMIFEVMAKYPTVLEIDTIRTALLDIMMLLLVENKSINATQNILTEGDGEKMKGMAKDSKRDILDKKLTAENSALKEEIIALMVGDDDNDDKNAADNSTKDLYSDNIALFMKEKGLERILDFVFQKIAGITTTTATEPSEIKEKKQRTEDVCVDEDLYYVVSAFMKLFSNIYSAIANKGFLAKEDDGTIRSINDKLSTIFSSIILRDFAAESVLPPFQLFLVIFKIFSDGFASNEMSKMNSLRNLKTLLAYKIVRSYVDASKEAKAKWLTCPLSKNTQSILAYTIDSLSYSFSTCKKLRSPDSQSLSLAREKIELACASASRGEYKYLSEALEQDACDVLSALALPSGEDESIIDIFISMSAALSKNLGFGAKGSDIKDPITVGEAKGSSISESLSENSSSSYMLGDLFGSEESQNGVEAGGNQNGGTKNEDDTCNLCAKLFAMCKQLIATAGAPKVSMKALDSLVAFAQNISPNDNITQAAESAAFAKSIRSKKNYQQVVTSFRDFTRVLLASDAKVGGNVGEAIARKVFEKFPLFGPLECVIMTTRFWAMNRVRAGSSADVRPLPAAVEIVHRFVDSLADRATSGSNNDYLELVNYERSEEILFIYNYCLTKESRMEVALFSLIKLAKTAEGVGSVKCSENLIALTRLVDFATYFSMFINKAPHTFANSVTENILERQFGESPAEEAFPCSVIADRNILFEHAAKHLELQPYYLFAGGKEEKCVLEAPIANCISSNVRSYIKLMGFAYENCDSRLMNYYKRVTYNFFLTVLTTKPGEEWVDDALLGSDTGLNSRGAVLLLLIGAFVESGSADLLKSLAEKVIDALSNESQTIDDDSTTFGLLLFVLSAIEANKPTKRDVSVPKRDKYTSLFETLASFDAKAETLGSDELVAQVSVPVSCIDIAAKPELEWDAKMVPMMNIAEKLLSKYIDIVGGKEANRLRGFVYGGLSFDKGVAAALLPEAEAYKKKFGDIATLPPIEQEGEGDSKLSAKDTLLHYVMSLANEKDREVALKINLNIAALIMIKIVCLGEQPKLNDAIDRFTSVCLAIDNFRFANYGVFFDTIVAVNKECTKTIAAGLWSLFAGPRTATSSSSSDEDRKAFSELVDSNAVLERLLKMHAMYPNHKTLYNIFVTYNGTHTNKIASALLKDGEKEAAGNRDYLIEAIRENGLNPEDDAVVQRVVLKLLASPMKDSIKFLCDVVKNDSDECPTAGFANKLYETLLNIIDNREVHAKIPPKTYFITIQLVSFRCSRLIDLFKFSVERLRAANSRMVVEDSDKAAAAELGRGVFVYPFITIIRSVIRMLTFKEAVKDGDPNMLIDQEETKVKNALDKMAESKPYWGCPENDPSIECTFVKTGKNFVDQTTYRCKTCQLVGNFGCCVMCAATCHKGHDLSLGNISSGFYCDCGDGSVSSCTKCILCNREESAKDDAMEVEKEHLPEQRGLYDIDALKPDYVAKLRAEVFNQDVSDVLNEYFNTYSASFISDINKEASTSGDESAQTTTTTAATGTKVQAERNEVTARTAVAKLSPEACRRLMSNSSLTGCVKQGNFSFATSRLNNDFPMYYDGSLPGMQSYAAVSAPFRKDAVAVLSRDTLRVLKLRDIVRSASQNSVASVPLPIRACGLAFHPTTPNLLTVFSPVECYVMLLERNSYSKVAHQTPVTLPQDDDYIILNVFWIPVPDTVGPFLCVVANKGVFVYDITKNADEPVVLCRNTRITGAVCVKAEVSAGTSQAPTAKVVLLSLSRGRGGSELDALCISGLGAEKASVEVKKVPKEGVAGDYAGIYYAESSKLLLLSLVRPSSVQGFFVTVDDDFNVALGNSMKVFGTTLLGITETVVEGVTVIAGFNRDRTNVYTLALGNEKVLYATAELASTVSGYNILESEDEGANESYLFIIQTNSRTGTSTISKRHVAASSNAIPSRNDAKAPAKADSGENAKAKKAKSATEPVSYAYMPQSAPELSCNSVYAMIRGDAKSYVIDGDLAGVMSPAAVRDKLMEPEASDYSRCGVLSLKRGEFTLRVVNTNSSRVITGIQIGLAHVHKGNVPDYITVYNRCIVVPNKDNLCISIPFTFQEIICSKSHVSIHFGPSKNGYEKVYIDYITPFFTEKKDFGLASEEWPSKRELIGYVSSTGARYVTSATSTATALITSLRAMEAVAVAPSADKKERSLVDTLLRVFTSVPGKVSKRFRLLDMIESHIKKSPAFVANVVESLSLIVDAIKDDSNENSRAAQLSTIATFLERVLSGESEEAFAAIVRSNIVRKLCDAAQTVGSAAAVEREGFIQGIVSLIFTTQVAMLSRGGGPAEGADDVHKALLDALLSLIVSENGAVRNGCSLAMRSHFERMSDGYRVTVEPSADRGTSSDFARSMCDYSAQYGGNAEVLIAAAKRMSLAAAKSEKLGPKSVVKSAVCLAPNTVDFCVWELQNLLGALPALAGLCGGDDVWDGRLIPVLYTILHLAVRAIRAAALCRPRSYVADLCRVVVRSLLPAASAAEFLSKEVMAGLPSTKSCYAVLRVATIATIVRECSRSSSGGATHEAVKWMVESLPKDFAAALYAFMDGPFTAEYERLSKLKASEAKLNIAAKATPKNCMPAELFRSKASAAAAAAAVMETGKPSDKESWAPLLADIFADALGGSPGITSFLYSKRLYIAALYLARKVAVVATSSPMTQGKDGNDAATEKHLFNEEQWAELIGRCMVQSKLRYAYPSLLKLARSILSSDTALFAKIDAVSQSKLSATLETLHARTEHFARAPSAEEQGRLLDLLYAQLSVTAQRPHNWRAYGLKHPTTAALLYRLVIEYAQNRRIRKDIVSISLALLGHLLDEDSKEECVLGDEVAKLIEDGGKIMYTLGDFINLFVVGTEPYAHPRRSVMASAANFVGVLLRTKLVSKAAANVVTSFLDDVVSNHPTAASSYYMDIVTDALSMNSEGNELCLLEALDAHTRNLNTYPEASLMVAAESAAMPPPECSTCAMDSAFDCDYYEISALCARDRIQVLQSSVTFMFGAQHGATSSSSLFVENVSVKLPYSVKISNKEVVVSVAYKPPVSSNSAGNAQSSQNEEEFKWAVISTIQGACGSTSVLGCGLHIVGVKVEVSGSVDEKGGVFVCSNCNCEMASLVCKKCRMFASDSMIWVGPGPVTPVKDRLDSEESVKKEIANLEEKLADTTLPNFLPK